MGTGQLSVRHSKKQLGEAHKGSASVSPRCVWQSDEHRGMWVGAFARPELGIALLTMSLSVKLFDT